MREPVPYAASWWAFVVKSSGTDYQRDIALLSGINKTNISMWHTGKLGPTARSVVQFCRTLNVSVLEGLAAAGYITYEEAHPKS